MMDVPFLAAMSFLWLREDRLQARPCADPAVARERYDTDEADRRKHGGLCKCT